MLIPLLHGSFHYRGRKCITVANVFGWPGYSTRAEMTRTYWTFPHRHVSNYPFLPPRKKMPKVSRASQNPAQVKEYVLTHESLGEH